MPAHTFTTHDGAAPTSEACLTAPNHSVSAVPRYIHQGNEPWAEQSGPGCTDYVRVKAVHYMTARFDTHCVYGPLYIHEAT